MAKTRAYTSEFGSTIVTAEAVGKIRRLHYNGQPTRERYFSTHRPGHRRPVKHVLRGNCFFAYVEGSGNTSASDGETLNHLLFKEALASVEQTRLSLYRLTTGKPVHWRDVPIRIRKAEVENPIERAGSPPFRADLRMEFEDSVGLALKWENQLYVEVRHTHAVGANKQRELRELEMPVIEVEVPELFAYGIADDHTSDEQEEAHRQRIKTILESERGFLKCVILSDPSSKHYLQRAVEDQRSKILALDGDRSDLKQSLTEVQRQLRTSAGEIELLSSQLEESRRTAAARQSSLNKQQLEMNNLRQQLSLLKQWRSWLSTACLALGIALALALAR